MDGNKIVGRTVHDNGTVTYAVEDSGTGDVDDIPVLEILEFVSALELETFENREFAEERKALDAAAAYEAKEEAEKAERRRLKARLKGRALSQEADGARSSTDDVDIATGKHGRLRPTYTHLFKKPRQPRPEASASENEEEEDEMVASGNLMASPQKPLSSLPVNAAQLPKRRRRKRDKVTGELLPLSKGASTSKLTTHGESQSEVRRRRRRHPITGELMPIGWRYDPESEKAAQPKTPKRRSAERQSFTQLSISDQQATKRPRLDTESSVSRSVSPTPRASVPIGKVVLTSPSMDRTAGTPRASQHKRPASEAPISGGSESEQDLSTPLALQRPIAMNSLAGSPGREKDSILAGGDSIAKSASPQLIRQVSKLPSRASPTLKDLPQQRQHQPTLAVPPSQTVPSPKQAPKTSILSPHADRASSTEPEDSGDDLGEDEWFIESVLDHRLSDPRTHPSDFGSEPVMLYLVKWEGYKEPTWEPVESFGDEQVVADYRKRVGLDAATNKATSAEEDASIMVATTAPRTPVKTFAADAKSHINPPALAQDQKQGSQTTDIEDGEYELESILSHRLSDPKTHPKVLGRTSVILYQVKWKDWPTPTWEPASSFLDRRVLSDYHARVGRQPV